MEHSNEQKHPETRADLEKIEEDLKSLKKRYALEWEEREMKTQQDSNMLTKIFSSVWNKGKELISWITGTEAQSNSDVLGVEQKDQQKHQPLSSDVEQIIQNVKLVQERFIQEQEEKEVRSAPEQGHEEIKALTNRLAEMEKEHGRMRTALKVKAEEFQSFKDRVADEVALSIKTGKTESMNSPVSKSRLKELYEELIRQWPKIKRQLKSQKENPENVKSLICEKFEAAAADVKQKKETIESLLAFMEHKSETKPDKVKHHIQSSLQDLQLALFHTKKDGDFLKVWLLSRTTSCSGFS
ncbi:uncharacterized protein KZ484_015743 isoform 2-T2 [Pholidichthys leucotaenia]